VFPGWRNRPRFNVAETLFATGVLGNPQNPGERRGAPQIPPLRYASVGMTILFGNARYRFQDELSSLPKRTRISCALHGTPQAIRELAVKDLAGRFSALPNLLVDTVKGIVGLQPSFSAQVRFGEPGAPVLPSDLRRADGQRCG
jgi:hypothetical protein